MFKKCVNTCEFLGFPYLSQHCRLANSIKRNTIRANVVEFQLKIGAHNRTKNVFTQNNTTEAKISIAVNEQYTDADSLTTLLSSAAC